MAASVEAAWSRIAARSLSGSARQAAQRTRIIWCKTAAPSMVSGTGGMLSFAVCGGCCMASLLLYRVRRMLKSRSMYPDVELVIELQALDQKSTALEKEVAALPKHIAVIEIALESHLRKLEADK